MAKSRRKSLVQFYPWLGAASVALAGGCRSSAQPANNSLLGLTLLGSGVQARVPNPCEVDVDFGDVATGRQERATLRIVNNGKAPVTLTPPSTGLNPAFTADFQALSATLQPGASGDVGLTFEPTAVGVISSTFSIATSRSAGACAAIKVNLTGSGVELAVDPTSLDCGVALLGTVAEKTVTLTNQAADPVSGLSATLDGAEPADFTVVGLPDMLDAGSSVEVSVRFKPRVLSASSTATVTFAGSAGQTAKLGVSGEPLAAALTLTPNPIDFGFVTPVTTVVACATAANVANIPVTITGLTGLTGVHSAYAASAVDDATPPKPAPIPVTIQPGGSAEVCFALTPPVPGQYPGQVMLATDQPTGMAPTLQLAGWGGGPQLSCTPASLAFGQILVGTASTLQVVCTNIGINDPAVGLTLVPSASALPFGATFDQVVDPYPADGLQAGQSAQIDVSYIPAGGTSDTGLLSIASNGGRGRGLQIPLSGQGLSLPACQYAISPKSLDFGNVALGSGRDSELSFWVENVGSGVCLAKDVALEDSTGSFRILSTSIAADPDAGSITIPAASGAASVFQVDLAFTPADAGVSTAQAGFWISNPAQTQQAVALRGTSGNSCLVVAPAALDFGSVGALDGGSLCKSSGRTISVFNQCTADATLQSIAVQSGPGETVAQFSVPAASTKPLGAGDPPQTYNVTFAPTTLGTHSAELVLSEGSLDTLVPISGTAVATSTQTDSFVVGPPKVDLLFVRDVDDDSYSEPAVANAMANFLDAGVGADYRLAVTTDDNPRNPEPNYGGWLQPCPICFADGPGPIIVSPSSAPDGGGAPDPVTVSMGLLGAGGATSLDTGTSKDKHLFLALFEALERSPRPGLDFFRPGAFLAVINESSDDISDQSYVVHPPAWFQSFFAAWTPDPALFSWSYINPTQTVDGTGLSNPDQLPPPIEMLVSSTHGFAFNLEDSNWPTAFPSVWTGTANANLRYHLSSTPDFNSSGLAVSVNGSAVPGTGWSYDSNANAVVFTSGSAPVNGDRVAVTYQLGCF